MEQGIQLTWFLENKIHENSVEQSSFFFWKNVGIYIDIDMWIGVKVNVFLMLIKNIEQQSFRSILSKQ